MFGKKRKTSVLSITLIIVSLLVLTQRFFFPHVSIINSASSLFLYPVLFAQRTLVVPVKNYFERRKKRKKIEQSFISLHKKYQNVLAQNVKLQATQNYYKDVSELIDFKKKYDVNFGITAQVILKNISQQTQFFLLDKGSMHGVQKDMVAVYKNNLLGRVVEVYPLYSKIILITDKACRVAAYCSKTKASGIHVGSNISEFTTLQRVSHLLSVKEGDLVISSGEGLVFPQGFALGRIKFAQSNDLYFDIKVEPFIAMQEIDYCILIQKN